MSIASRISSQDAHTQARIVAVCHRQRGVIEHGQLLGLGLSRSGIAYRVASLRLFEVAPRVYALSPVITDDALRAAMVLSVRGRTLLSSWSAAELLTWTDRPSSAHHVTTTGHARTRPGLVVHRTRCELAFMRVRGLPITTPDRVLLDLAMHRRGRALERLVGEALFHGHLTEDGVRAATTVHPGHRGAGNLRRIDPTDAQNRRTETPLEEEALGLLDAMALPPFVCQLPLIGLSGRRYRADFVWRDQRAILETDGRSSHQRQRDMEKDRARDADLLAVGWVTMRVTRRQLRAATFGPRLVAILGV